MKRIGIGLVSVAIGVMLVSAPALATAPTDTADQSAAFVTYFGSFSSAAYQTFTAGLSGHLTRVDLYCYRNSDTLTAEISVTVEGETATATCPASPEPQIGVTPQVDPSAVEFTFASPPSVTANTQYEMTIDPGEFSIHLGTATGYAGGQALNNAHMPIVQVQDFAFSTYVKTDASTSSAPPATTSTPAPTATVDSARPASGATDWLVPTGLTCLLVAVLVVRRRIATAR